jgi:hypothetical protein
MDTKVKPWLARISARCQYLIHDDADQSQEHQVRDGLCALRPDPRPPRREDLALPGPLGDAADLQTPQRQAQGIAVVWATSPPHPSLPELVYSFLDLLRKFPP